MNERTAYDDLELEPRLRARLREASYARARGAPQSPVAFVDADELPGAIRPSGLYAVDDRKLRVKLVLRRNGSTKEVRVEGLRLDLDGFAEGMMQSILQAAAEWNAASLAEP